MDAVFLKLLNMSITAACIALAVAALRFPLKRAPKWISYALWSAVLFRLVCPVSFSSALSLFSLLGAPAAESGSMNHIPADIASALSPAGAGASADAPWLWLTIAAFVWLAGTAAVLCYSLVSHVRLKRRIADATSVGENVYETDAVASPFVYGFLKPRIYLPLGLTQAERRYVLLHERAHIARRDYLVKPFALATLAAHWFNPVIWLAFRLMNLDMEMSCDERVIREFSREETADYGEALLRLRVRRPLVAGSPVAFNENSTAGRIRNVLNHKKPAFWLVALSLAAAAVACVCLISNPKPDGEREALGTPVPTESAGTPGVTETPLALGPGEAVIIGQEGNVVATVIPEIIPTGQTVVDDSGKKVVIYVYDSQGYLLEVKTLAPEALEGSAPQGRVYQFELEAKESPGQGATP